MGAVSAPLYSELHGAFRYWIVHPVTFAAPVALVRSDTFVGGVIVVIGTLAGSWLAFLAAFLFGWWRFHERMQNMDQADEAAYRSGLDRMAELELMAELDRMAELAHDKGSAVA
jgi:hypothetical protein